MASASNSTTLYNNNGYGFTLTASFNENSTNVANNTSNITCTATFTASNSNWSTSYNSTLIIYWHDNREGYDRQVASINFAGISLNSSKTASGTINVTHKDDGTLSGYAYAVFTKGQTTTSWACNSGGVTTSWTALTTIARASQPSINTWPQNSPDFNIGDTITIHMNRKSSAFTHTVTLYFGNYSYQIATGVTDNCTLDTSTIANNLYQQIPNANVGEGNITVTTYNGSTQIGTKSCLFYAHVVNSSPTFSAEYQDINSSTIAITDDNQQLIRNNSTLQIAISNASAKNYATLSSLTAVINGTTYTGSLRGTGGSIDVGTLNLSSNTTAQVILTDSRGISTTQNLNLIILDWVLPTAIITLQRQNNFYSETDINVNAEYSSLDNKNTITIKTRYKKTTDTTYSSYTTLQDNVTSQLTLDNNYAWDVQVLLQDRIGNTTYNLTLDRGIPIAFFDRLKRSLGINCFPQNNTSLEVNGEVISGSGLPNDAVIGYDSSSTIPNGYEEINVDFLDYSTTEKIVGRWIDNKPIYRKVFSFTTPTGNNDYVINTGLSMDKIIRVYGGTSSASGGITPIPTAIDFNGTIYATSFRVANSNIYYRGNSAYGSQPAFAIIEYTKTTD